MPRKDSQKDAKKQKEIHSFCKALDNQIELLMSLDVSQDNFQMFQGLLQKI